jgi:hypothetical protein
MQLLILALFAGRSQASLEDIPASTDAGKQTASFFSQSRNGLLVVSYFPAVASTFGRLQRIGCFAL